LKKFRVSRQLPKNEYGEFQNWQNFEKFFPNIKICRKFANFSQNLPIKPSNDWNNLSFHYLYFIYKYFNPFFTFHSFQHLSNIHQANTHQLSCSSLSNFCSKAPTVQLYKFDDNLHLYAFFYEIFQMNL